MVWGGSLSGVVVDVGLGGGEGWRVAGCGCTKSAALGFDCGWKLNFKREEVVHVHEIERETRRGATAMPSRCRAAAAAMATDLGPVPTSDLGPGSHAVLVWKSSSCSRALWKVRSEALSVLGSPCRGCMEHGFQFPTLHNAPFDLAVPASAGGPDRVSVASPCQDAGGMPRRWSGE